MTTEQKQYIIDGLKIISLRLYDAYGPKHAILDISKSMLIIIKNEKTNE